MDTTLLSIDRGALRRAYVGVASVALLAACDTDRPLEPTAPKIPAAAQPAIGSAVSGTVTWTVYTNFDGKLLLGGARFKVTGTNMSLTLTDNDVNDDDPIPGRFKLADLKPGTLKVCEIAPPTGYLLAEVACRQVTVYANGTTATAFVHASKPVMMTEVLNSLNQPVGGATLTIKDAVGVTIMVVADNDAKDLDKIAGRFRVIIPAGTYKVCPTTPPAGMTFGPNPVCYTTTFEWNEGTGVGPFWVLPL